MLDTRAKARVKDIAAGAVRLGGRYNLEALD